MELFPACNRTFLGEPCDFVPDAASSRPWLAAPQSRWRRAKWRLSPPKCKEVMTVVAECLQSVSLCTSVAGLRAAAAFILLAWPTAGCSRELPGAATRQACLAFVAVGGSQCKEKGMCGCLGVNLKLCRTDYFFIPSIRKYPVFLHSSKIFL